ncbi:MAG: hypothetical protein MJ051_02925 [Akkermansia sp.]|nr:hypothetical protein [Akkermansia sp.]
MRTAATRIEVLDSVASARRGAGDCMSALHLSGRTLGYGAAALAGSLLTRMVLRPARPKYISPVAVKAPSPWSGLAVQAISLLVLPLAHAYLTGDKKLPTLPKLAVPSLKMPTIDLTYLFFRWLGLVK